MKANTLCGGQRSPTVGHHGRMASVEVSDCCGALVDVSAADEGTGCWMCRECGKPCDARRPSRSQLRRFAALEGRDVEFPGEVTTPCPTPCDPGCELGTAGCHEHHAVPWKRSHDPERCERERAALDEHSRLSWEIERAGRD